MARKLPIGRTIAGATKPPADPTPSPQQADIEDYTRRSATPPAPPPPPPPPAPHAPASAPTPTTPRNHAYQVRIPESEWPDVQQLARKYAERGSVNTYILDALRYYAEAIRTGKVPPPY